MSEECIGHQCVACGRIIQGGNYYCPKCKACICLYCGAELLREVEVPYLKCPRCGIRLK